MKFASPPAPSSPVASNRDAAKGFTLVELLAVIAVIAMLISVGGMAFRPAQGIDRAVNGLTGFLEQSKTYAEANNTCVWVGFHEHDQTIIMAAVAGVTGAQTDVNNASMLRSIGRHLRFEGVKIGEISGLADWGDTHSGQSSSISDFTRKVGGADMTFTQVIQFNPRGSVTLDQQSIPQWMRIRLLAYRGDFADTQNDATLQVAGLTGRVRILKP